MIRATLVTGLIVAFIYGGCGLETSSNRSDPHRPAPADGEMPPAPPEEAEPADAVLQPPTHPSGLPFHDWRRLELGTASGILLEGRVVLIRKQGHYEPPEGGQGRPALLLRTETRAKALIALDLEIESFSELDPTSGASLEFLEVRPREKAKLLRVDSEQLLLVRYAPPKGRPEAALEDWEVTKRVQWARPAVDGSPVPLFDYYALIAHLGDLPLHAVGDRTRVWLASTSGPLEMDIRVTESRQGSRRFRDLAAGPYRTVSLEELRLRLRPLGGNPDKVRGFLNMEGETEVWVEAQSRTLLEVTGRIPPFGEISVVLQGLR